jgi:hypothetical protein
LPNPKKKISGIFIKKYTRINYRLDLTKNKNIRHLNSTTVITSRESSNRLGFFLTWAFFFWGAIAKKKFRKESCPAQKRKSAAKI